jgi:hypothetical protein
MAIRQTALYIARNIVNYHPAFNEKAGLRRDVRGNRLSARYWRKKGDDVA